MIFNLNVKDNIKPINVVIDKKSFGMMCSGE